MRLIIRNKTEEAIKKNLSTKESSGSEAILLNFIKSLKER